MADSKTSTAYLYTLADPRTGEVRYVGWTGDPKKRLRAHLTEARDTASWRGRNYKSNWIRSLIRLGIKPSFRVVALLEADEARWAEIKYIASLRMHGARLVNTTDGGEGMRGYKPSEETRRRLSEAQRGKHHTPESKAKLSAALCGRVFSQEHRAKLSDSNRRRGQRPSEVRAKISQSKKGKPIRPRSPEAIERGAAKLRGKKRPPYSEEWRAALSRAGMGRKMPPRTPEWRAAQSAQKTGIHPSVETRARMSEAHLRYYAAKQSERERSSK